MWGPLFRLGGPQAVIGLTLPRLVGPHADRETVGTLAWQLSDSRRRDAMLGYYLAFLTPPEIERTRQALARVQVPVLIVWGETDQVVPVAVAAEIARSLPAGVAVTTERLPSVGHLPPLEAPAAVARALDTFVATLSPAPRSAPGARVLAPHPLVPGKLLYGARHEWFPLIGVSSIFSTDGRIDAGLVAGVARGSIDRHYPLETGRVVWTAGFALHTDPLDPRGAPSFAYLRTTLRLELVWRWAGGFHLDGTLLVDPLPERLSRVGGWGAIGYSPSVVPWLRAFVGYGAFPDTGGRVLFGIEIDARLTGLLY